jgi:hypothetical protein
MYYVSDTEKVASAIWILQLVLVPLLTIKPKQVSSRVFQTNTCVRWCMKICRTCICLNKDKLVCSALKFQWPDVDVSLSQDWWTWRSTSDCNRLRLLSSFSGLTWMWRTFLYFFLRFSEKIVDSNFIKTSPGQPFEMAAGTCHRFKRRRVL